MSPQAQASLAAFDAAAKTRSIIAKLALCGGFARGAGGLSLLGTRNTSLPAASSHTSRAPGGASSFILSRIPLTLVEGHHQRDVQQ
jgi:hypothetical protein